MNKEQVLEVVLQATGVSRDQFFSKNRKREFVMARYVFFWLCRKYFDTPYNHLGKFVGNDHATVIHGENMVNDMLAIDYTPYVDLIRSCKETIRDKYLGDYKLQVFAPYNVDMDKLIDVLTKEFYCRVTKNNA